MPETEAGNVPLPPESIPPLIFDGTPLSDYLSDAAMSDWGIDEQQGSTKSDDNDYVPLSISDNDFFQGDYDLFDKQEVERMRKRIISNSSAPFPLLLSPSNDISIPQLRKQRFLSLIRNALRPQLNDVENNKFLERFRYILVSSQLLESTIDVNSKSVRHQNLHPHSRLSSRKHNILFGDDGPWNTLKMHKKYWTGGGGCIFVVVTLLSWQVKRKAVATTTRATATTSLIIVLAVFLFLFAHSRRKLLRLLRSKSLAYASYFVENNHSFDIAISKCLSLIQEIDLLSLGYRPDLIANSKFRIPVSTINSSNYIKHTRTAKSLRSAVSSCLYLAITSYLNAIEECINYSSELDVRKYFDIYQLQTPQQEFGFVMNDDFVGFTNLSKDDYYGSTGANVSLKFLRNEFNRLHFLRRAFICCLISIPANGVCNKQELNVWGTVVDELESCSGLMMRLANTISKDNLFPEPAVEDHSQLEEHNQSRINQVNQLNRLTSSLQHIQARIYLLSEEDRDYEYNYELLGKDIEELSLTWKSNNRPPAFKRTHIQNASTSTAATLVDITDEESIISSNDDSSSTISESLKYGSIREGPSRSTSGTSMTILEGIVETESKPPRSSLSRQARISVMNQQREVEAQKKSVIQQRDNFVLELGNVLHQRRNLYD